MASNADNMTFDKFALLEARRDVNAFIEIILKDKQGRALVQGKIHEDLHSFISVHRHAVIEWPRGHGKTTQIGALIAWLIGNNSNILIKIVCCSDTEAGKRGNAIKTLMSLPIYRAIFPEIKQGLPWTDSRLMVQRTLVAPDATLECYGLDSGAIGGRADVMIFDDPDTEDVIFSEAVRTHNVSKINNTFLPFIAPDGRAYILCTPWHERDIAHTRGPAWKKQSVAIKDGVPVWPEKWGVKELADERAIVGTLAYMRGFELQMLNLENAPVKGSWFKYWLTVPPISALVISVDPAISLGENADWFATQTIGMDAMYNCYLLEQSREHIDFPTALRNVISIANAADHENWVAPQPVPSRGS